MTPAPARSPGRRRRRASLLACLVPAGILACVPEAPLSPSAPGTPADPAAIDQVVFLLGDAGEASSERTPLMAHLEAEVERWSGALARDAGVSVVFLGDNVYPAGVRDPGDPGRTADSLHLDAQIRLVAGPQARRRGSRGLFLAGNHDWGNRTGDAGRARLENLEAMLAGQRGRAQVGLHPAAGSLAPEVLDLGPDLRIVFLDTHAWIQAQDDPAGRASALRGLRAALEGAGGRSVVLAAHHPFASGGEHAGAVPFWRTLGVEWLLHRAGALVQDLNSAPYGALREELARVFAEAAPPLLYAAGHDHSLQVIEHQGPGTPRWTLVSGSGSKSGRVGATDGLRYAADRPGYARLDLRRDGGVDLRVAAGPERFRHCDGAEAERAACMREGAEAFQEVFTVRLRTPSGRPGQASP